MNNLEQLQPTSLWRYFQAICAIPHPSHHEQQLAAYLVEFAKQHHLSCEQDDVGNVIIRKRAALGCEQAPGVILQAHMDMVPQKNSDVLHDFAIDPIHAYVDSEWVRARGTTLGADNGIGIAAALAVLETSAIQHGPLEVLFTVNEESGMSGARGLQPGVLKGDILLNLDTEGEGELYVGCAGGTRLNARSIFVMESVTPGMVWREINLRGLCGGHSGCDIHLGRGNAIVLLTRVLQSLTRYGVRVASFNGGSLPNAIPREASSLIGIPVEVAAECAMAVDMFTVLLHSELKEADPALSLTMDRAEEPRGLIPQVVMNDWLTAIHACPNGVQRMSCALPGVVETSNNIGVLTIAEGIAYVQMLARSLVDSARQETENRALDLFKMIGAQIWTEGAYPGWQPKPNSPVLALMQNTYKALYGKDAAVKVVHAGLECGLLGGTYPNWDMISIGPTIESPHSPDEKVHIKSVDKFWGFLLASLKVISEQKR